MLIVKVKSGENIERALKQMKRKVQQTKQIIHLRENEKFTKPSVKKRQQKLKAIYIQKLRDEEGRD